ncbi:hypothetical protein J36TS2_38560 [Bacillus paralicheniformis]|nr:hypothetical protein J23TS8_35790 [Bacillus paralicheniformis]GIN50375.1 hypothetical protein J25TS1_36290 [Bacillus paralicheniformis]GIN54962.1 hypothetical protein J36TS2_38560 [Bacillus paralicheniformis]
MKNVSPIAMISTPHIKSVNKIIHSMFNLASLSQLLDAKWVMMREGKFLYLGFPFNFSKVFTCLLSIDVKEQTIRIVYFG